MRQSLFKFDDSVQKREKAQAAAESISLIAPSVDTAGVKLGLIVR